MKSDHSDATDHTDDGNSNGNGVVGASVRSDDTWDAGPREVPRARQRFETRPTPTDPARARVDRGADGADDIDSADDHLYAERIPAVAIGSWQDIKSQFVDDPAAALEAAEAMVNSALDDRIRAIKAEAAAVCARDPELDPAATAPSPAASTETMRTRLIRLQAFCERLAAETGH